MITLENWTLALAIGVFAGSAAMADGYKDCTKLNKASWKPAGDAEAKAKAAGYEIRRSKVEGSCYEVYGVKEQNLRTVLQSRRPQPEAHHRKVN